ncbi:MAG: ABC transporter ATP-binding protein [Thermodesulfobacteriota bacterium]
MLFVNNLHAGYGDLPVLHDVSFSVNQGEIVVLVGANGAGKSTVIRAVSGLIRPGSGEIVFRGEPIHTLPAYGIISRGIVHVPEGRRLFPQMTVEENLVMGSLGKGARQKRRQTMEHVFRLFPRLLERRRQFAGTLSGGEQQMLAIGRGLMGLPELMMFDEPSLGLAPILVQNIFAMIREIKNDGVTILLVEQNVNQTLSWCDRAYVLENGRIKLSGTGTELLNNDEVKEAFLGI